MNIITLNLPDSAPPEEEKELNRDANAKQDKGAEVEPAAGRELGLWLLALNSFFNLRNHSFSEEEREELRSRDFSNEVVIVQQAERRCLQLISMLRAEEQGEPAAPGSPSKFGRFDGLDAVGGAPDSFQLDELGEVLSDGADVCEALLQSSPVNFQAWRSLGRIVGRELSHVEAFPRLARIAGQPSPTEEFEELFLLAKRLSPEALGADVRAIFSSLLLMLERLRKIDTLLKRDYWLKQISPLLTLLYQDGRDLVELIERRAMRIEGLPEEIFDALDRTGYALRMELCKVYTHELVGLAASRQAPVIYGKVENAHGLLRDCCQQSTVALAQIFDESVAGAKLFTDFRAKLDQSLALRNDLWELLQHVMRAAKGGGQRPLNPLLERLNAFQRGSLRHLMYKDWETYERFVMEIATARESVELTPVFHRLGTYLETLFGQINMRAVLIEHPFDYPTHDE